jgi:AcrR family transcriptional regulator
MAVTRQAPAAETGRVNQKRRTRTAIVAAAQELLDEGTTPTVAEAAERALVSRTTAYRYFPTQESLLVELTVNIEMTDIEALVARPVDRDDVAARVVELVETFNQRVLDDERPFRTALRLYLDQWLAADDDGDAPVVREGRRVRWLEELLRPLEGEIPDDELRRLRLALCLVTGAEIPMTMRDVCHLDTDEAIAVTRFAAEAILAAALDQRNQSVQRSTGT